MKLLFATKSILKYNNYSQIDQNCPSKQSALATKHKVGSWGQKLEIVRKAIEDETAREPSSFRPRRPDVSEAGEAQDLALDLQEKCFLLRNPCEPGRTA